MTRDITKLIEAIDRVGIQNISLLSRMSGMPVETVRYTVKKRFPTLGLDIRTPVNYDYMGLERYFVVMKFTEESRNSAPAILDSLSSSAFLTYWVKSPADLRYLSFFAVPVAVTDEFRKFMDRLVHEGVLTEARIERLEWSRHPEIKSRFYDFSRGAWSIDWDEIAKQTEKPPAISGAEEPSASPEIDSTDTLIIKELELDSWRNIAEIARKLRINERTLRWHYAKHVSPTALSSYVHWLPDSKKDVGTSAGLVYEFNNLTKKNLEALRTLFNNFPFSWFEAGRKDGYYQVHCAVPAGSLMESMRFLSQHLSAQVGTWTAWTLDLSTSFWYTIPYENYDDEKGWFFEPKSALEKILPQKMRIKAQRWT